MILDKLWREHRRARKEVDKLWRQFEPDIARAKGRGEEDHQAVLEQFFVEKDKIEEPVKRLRTRRWLEEASSLGVLL